MNKLKKRAFNINIRSLFFFMGCGVMVLVTGCGNKQSATVNSKMNSLSTTQEETTTANTSEMDLNSEKTSENVSESDTPNTQSIQADNPTLAQNANAIFKGNSTYDCDIEADKEGYSGTPDIVVGDNYYATQINDWYENFDLYEGKTVEIEGYFISDYEPYEFVGRKGPTCPYCVGSYVCFEFLSNEDLTQLESGKDWIKVTGILREGIDNDSGPFQYIEVLDLQVMDEAGMETVTN